MLIIYAPDRGAEAVAREMDAQALPLQEAALTGAEAVIFVTPDYYTHACWEVKRYLSRVGAALSGRLCSCVVVPQRGGGGELAMRTIVSQLLALSAPVYLCASLCPDGLLRPGGSGEDGAGGMTMQAYCAKMAAMARTFAG